LAIAKPQSSLKRAATFTVPSISPGGVSNKAHRAISAVLETLNLGRLSDAQKKSVLYAHGSDETDSFLPGEVARMNAALVERHITFVEVVHALAARGFATEAARLLSMARQRVTGDYLQTAAIIRDGRVVSAINDPNRYNGPGTGYVMTAERWQAISRMRHEVSKRDVFAAGNLLRGAETADTCALEGARVARHIHDYLNTGQWPAASLPVQVKPPIIWMFPNVVRVSGERPVAGGFTFRVREFCQDAQVTVWQGEKSLYAQSFRQLSPNDSARLGSDWLAAVNPAGEALRVGVRHY